MKEFSVVEKTASGISDVEIADSVKYSICEEIVNLRKVLLIVPDYTRYHSNAGLIANKYYHLLKDSCQVDLLEALGTHVPMTREECADMYGDIPFDRFIAHRWRRDIVRLGRVPASFVSKVSEGIMPKCIDVEVNHLLFDGYDLIISIGQVVPHEVVGMANQSKNIFVGCGGASMINSLHKLGAYYGMERMMGRDKTPVRKVFDYAQEKFLKDLPLVYVLTVTTAFKDTTRTHGLYFGRQRKWFEQAVAQAQQYNLTLVDTPLKKVVVYLNAQEYKSTWLGNKSIYRTRMAIADGGELIVLAPGVAKFGEDEEVDRLIRKYGYCGREKIIELSQVCEDLQNNMGAAAHLIHGSSDERFTITYCTQHLERDVIEGVNFKYMPYEEAVKAYDPEKLIDGFNNYNNENIYYISNPALGLWADKNRFLFQ